MNAISWANGSECRIANLRSAGRVSKGALVRGIFSFAIVAIVASSSHAAMITGFSGDGDPVSAKADFSRSGDTLTVVLTNTTPVTQSADELLTGIDFMIMGGGGPTLTLATGAERTVSSTGSFTVFGPNDVFTDSWSLEVLSGSTYRLDFNPNAKHAIIGPPNAPAGVLYSSANGSIKANPGHNPFVGETAEFQINVPGLSNLSGQIIQVKAFLFGTGPNPLPNSPPIIPTGELEVPEPGTFALLGIAAVGLLGVRRFR